MKSKYWKVQLRYGHVGRGKSIEVNRYLVMSNKSSSTEIIRLAKTMPGVKKGIRAVLKLEPINKNEYYQGKKREKENFYLQKLNSYHQSPA